MTKLPRVYPILDSEALARRGIAMETAAAAFLEGGAGILQIRHKGHWSRETFASGKRIAALCREAGAQFVVNDRADFALLLDAGLHIGPDDLAPREARKLMGSEPTIGFSSHNLETTPAPQPKQLEPVVDYVALGPIFAHCLKLDPDPAVGLEELRRCRALIEKPLVAIGGIALENALEVWRAGADSVAVIAGLLPASGSARGRSYASGWSSGASWLPRAGSERQIRCAATDGNCDPPPHTHTFLITHTHTHTLLFPTPIHTHTHTHTHTHVVVVVLPPAIMLLDNGGFTGLLRHGIKRGKIEPASAFIAATPRSAIFAAAGAARNGCNTAQRDISAEEPQPVHELRSDRSNASQQDFR